MSNITTTEKQLATLQAQFVLHGYALHHNSRANDTASFCAERWDQVQYLDSVEGALRFLALLGGHHE